MKKIIYSLISGLAFAVLLGACTDVNDQFDELDAKTAITNVKTYNYTLTTADYTSLGGAVKTSNAFSATSLPTDFLPAFLGSKYPYLDQGSAVKVTYNYKNAYPVLTAYTASPKYTLVDADYAAASTTIGVAKYFSPLNSASKYLPAILAASVPTAVNGDTYLVSYKYSDVEPKESAIQDVTVYTNDFAESLGDFAAYSAAGDQNWGWTSYSGDGYAKMTGYASGNKVNEDWLVSPQIDLTGISSTTFNITQTAKYVNAKWDQLTVSVSTDFNGSNPTTATWTTLTLTNMPTGADWTFVNSGDVNLSAYDGKKIFIAMKYISTDTNAATWEVTDLAVKGKKIVTKSATITDPIAIEEFYTYNSGWKKTVGAYYLTTPDYDVMGETSGKPGQYNNFSSSILPANYLPNFLKVKFPFALEGDIMNVVYKYYSTTTQTRADQYMFTSGTWTVYNPLVTKTDQYLRTASGWLFDPTVLYTMDAPDYQLVVDYVKASIGATYVSSYGNDESYYGTSAYYKEFQTGAGKFNSKFSKWQDAVKEAISKGFLPSKYPNAVAKVDGVDVKYIITFAGYDGGMLYYTITFQCTKSGPNPEFTYVEGPTLK